MGSAVEGRSCSNCCHGDYRNLDFRPPSYDVEEGSQEVKLTYLDTMGRPVIVARASNLVEQHVQDFHLYYSFQSVMLLQEPLLIVAALLIFFLCVIVIVRLDFSITEVSKVGGANTSGCGLSHPYCYDV